jgi:hypothetical protein
MTGLDCPTEFSYKPIPTATSGYSLELKLKEGESTDYTFELIDLQTGKSISKKKVFFSAGESRLVFESLKASTYSVYYSSSACPSKQSIKGKGIVLQ